MKKRYVFDLDGTLLNGDFQMEYQLFMDTYGEQVLPIVHSIPELLAQYEKNFFQYDYDVLSEFLTKKTGLDIKPSFIKEWVSLIGEIPSVEEEYVRETLEYLKQNGKSLVVLTNWFGVCQKERLKRAGILSYFDDVYGGDIYTKPHKEAYLNAISPFSREESVFVGDNVEMDYIGPKSYGIDSIIYDRDNLHHNSLVKIKRLDDLKNIK